MKKLITLLLTATFFLVTTSLAFADQRGYHRGHFRGSHHHGHSHRSHIYYHASGDLFLFGLGMGVLTGIVASNAYNTPPPAPAQVVHYKTAIVPPQPVVSAERQGTTRFGSALAAQYGTVKVAAAELNLRSGPDTVHSVTGAVYKGEVLAVIESIEGWYYIRTPDGVYGWVMDKYTLPARPVG